MIDKHKRALRLAGVMLAGALLVSTAFAGPGRSVRGHDRNFGDALNFNRVATFANYLNNEDIGDETVSEIVAATMDGQMLVYTDGELETIGFVDITDPYNPLPDGTVEVGGEPTSVSVLGNEYALVGVNTSESFVEPGGSLVVVDIASRTIVATLDLGGQPDSLSISPDGNYAAIAIENERDEEVCVGGEFNGSPVPEDGPEEPGDITEDQCEEGGGLVGVLPQTGIGNPAGYLAVVDILGAEPSAWTVRFVEMTGLADYAPEDPEPEFVDINPINEAVVSLQENNHIVIVDLPTGEIVSHFSAGTMSLEGVDATEDDLISLTESLSDIPREPDAVTWISIAPYTLKLDKQRGKSRRNIQRGQYVIGTANEGDIFGGSRGFTIFRRNGQVISDSASTFEELAVRAGHYPEGRSENKGSEPEAIESARFGRDSYLFVGSERGSFIGVYTLDPFPRLKQVLPGPLGPEGVLAIPSRDLLVVSGEEDDPSFGVRSTIMIYELQSADAQYPQIVSGNGEDGRPIGWSALSGMVSVPGTDDEMVAVWDSFYAEARIFHIDASQTPAVITKETAVSGGAGDIDAEGILIAPDGTYWIASEGDDPGKRANRLIQVDTDGAVLLEVTLPQEIEDCRAASDETGPLDNGFEGLALRSTDAGPQVLAAQQLPWTYTTAECEMLDDETGFTRIWTYDLGTGEWSHIAYELAPTPENASWVGLSEITLTPSGDYLLIERDNRTGDFTGLKTVVLVTEADMADGVITADEKSVLDIIPALSSTKGWITDKPEGLAVNDDGDLYLVTDNDGVDDWSGETTFLLLGNIEELFGAE